MNNATRITALLSLSAAAALAGCISEPADDLDSDAIVLESEAPPPLACVGGDDCPSQKTGVFLWRGFNHQWGYHHRLGRIGDFIRPAGCVAGAMITNCQAKAVHTAATGVAPDDVGWKSFNTFVATGSASFLHRQRTISLSGSEGSWVENEIEIVVPSVDTENVAVLRGFDATSQADADRLEKLTLKIKNEWYDAAAGEFHFTVYAGGNLACDSAECQALDSAIDYDVTVFATVVSGQTGNFNHTRGPVVSNAYGWADHETPYGFDPSAEIFRRDYRVNDQIITGDGAGQYPIAALAFRRLTVDLDADHHMLEMDMTLLPQDYDPLTGEYKYDLRLFFKQWGVDMPTEMFNQLSTLNAAQLASVPLLAPCAASVTDAGLCLLEEPGDATFKATAVLLQFASGEAETGMVGDVHHWNGLNIPAGSPDAVDWEPLTGSFTN